MRARASIRAWASAAFFSVAIAGCSASEPCTRIFAQIEAARSSEAGVIVSDRVGFYQTRRALARARIVERGAFTPVGHEMLHTCLGADWRGAVEPAPRAGWAAPAIVYSRNGWPNVVLLEDREKLEIRIERTRQ